MTSLIGKTLLIATHNEGKRAEFAELIAPFGVTVKSMADFDLPVPEETGTTFEQNALIKAKAGADATGLPSLADDSGLCVDALGGEPGIYTADWAEKEDGGRDFGLAMQKVEHLLIEKGATDPKNRKAQFVATLCLCNGDSDPVYFRGEAPGTLVWPPRGEQGFGYDPVFLPDGHDITFGEMPASTKHGWKQGEGDGLSHRARAFAMFARACLAAA
ncbi:MAG: RdgB/HAM1 family non-canonical purine NTP pyrophosphatase [Pseudomonadota bacterium]